MARNHGPRRLQQPELDAGEVELTKAALAALSAIPTDDFVSFEEIAERAGIGNSTVVRFVPRWEERGLLDTRYAADVGAPKRTTKLFRRKFDEVTLHFPAGEAGTDGGRDE